ncbi:MAG: hypothetical protein NC222_06450 [Staphylococcus sp.]|nr:hypothetical protein [Staphylococcus sp.]
MDFNFNLENNQNNDVQVFIIKQVDYDDREYFEKKYNSFLGTGFSFKNHNNFAKDLNNFIKTGLGTEKRESYLIPLIYSKDEIQDQNNFSDFIGNDLKLLKLDDNSDKSAIDLVCYTRKQQFGKSLLNQIYINTKYNSILKCPLLDYTKLAYVFQTNKLGFLGISDVTSFNVNLNTQQPSSASINLFNFNNKYNLDYEDSLNEHRDIFQSVFDTNDIVILRIGKRADKPIKQKFADMYASSDDDHFQTVFTGYINNVNETINWQSKSQTLTLICSGASKDITYKRLITGQAVIDTDSTSALVPLSCYSIPQALDKDNKITLKNKEIIKNIIVRTLTSIDNIPECYIEKKLFESSFNKNVQNSKNNQEFYKQMSNNRNKYNNAINKYFDDFVFDSEKEYNEHNININTGYISIYKNIFKRYNSNMFLPCFVIKGTNQPAFQYAFEQFNNMFVANYDTVYQFIKKIANQLEFVFYDDQFGVIHFELINTDIFHLYDPDDSNNFTQVLSFSKEQNTDNVTNILSIASNSEFSGILEGKSLGILSVIRDPLSIKKYGERPMTPRNIVGLINKEGCDRYGRNLMYKMTRKINSYTLSMIGDPSIKLGKYGYFKDYKKLFYVESIKHQYTSGTSLISTVIGSYEREIIDDVFNSIKNSFNFFGIDESKKRSNPYSNFLFLKEEINKKLAKSNYNYCQLIDEIWWGKTKFNIKDHNDIMKNRIKDFASIQEHLLKIYGSKCAYLNKSEKDIIQNIFYSYYNIPFLYFDGYFWSHNFENNLYYQAALEQEEAIKNNTVKNNGKKTKSTTTKIKKHKTDKPKTKEPFLDEHHKKVLKEYWENIIYPFRENKIITVGKNFAKYMYEDTVEFSKKIWKNITK